MAGTYSTRAGAWIYDLLANDTIEPDPEEQTIPLRDQGIDGDRVFDYINPSADGTYVVYQYQGGFDITPSGPGRLMSSLLFAVKVSGEGNSVAGLEPINDRIDHLMETANGATRDGYYVEARREQELALPPQIDGDVITREIGGLYRLIVYRT